jgi:hypothetical protein
MQVPSRLGRWNWPTELGASAHWEATECIEEDMSCGRATAQGCTSTYLEPNINVDLIDARGRRLWLIGVHCCFFADNRTLEELRTDS